MKTIGGAGMDCPNLFPPSSPNPSFHPVGKKKPLLPVNPPDITPRLFKSPWSIVTVEPREGGGVCLVYWLHCTVRENYTHKEASKSLVGSRGWGFLLRTTSLHMTIPMFARDEANREGGIGIMAFFQFASWDGDYGLCYVWSLILGQAGVSISIWA